MGKLRQYLFEDVAMSATDWLVDCVVMLGAFGFGVAQLALSANLFVPDTFTRMILGITSVSPSVEGTLATFLTCLPLVVRRRFPWPVFASTLLLWVLFDWAASISSLSIVATLVALFTLAYERARGEAVWASAVTLAVIIASVGLGSSYRLASLVLFQNIALVVAVTFAGYALNARQQLVAEAEKRAAEAERTRESEASRRVEEERVRIARELHDITAHSLSAVSIQAAAAERLIDTDPEHAREAVSQVRAIAKESLDDMRAMVGVLRAGSEAYSAPVGGSEHLGELVAYLEGAGLTCTLDTQGYDRQSVPAHIDIALFGIAREACTNIVRHAGAQNASITLRIVEDASTNVASLVVEDDGCGMMNAAHSGHGIEGMRERATLLSGRFTVGPRAGGGTRLAVTIPLRMR